MSKFSDFLTEKKLHPARLRSASASLETLRFEDRVLRLARRKKDEDAKKPEGDVAKPRSGRPITPRALSAAMTGKPLSGPQKNRFLRAINKLLEQKKEAAVELRALFLSTSAAIVLIARLAGLLTENCV